MEQEYKVFICAGEASGDVHAAAFMSALRERCAPRKLVFRGFGGDAMKAQGAELLYHTDETAVMGIFPVLAKLPFFLRMARRLKQEILDWKPDLVFTVDYPGLNLRLDAFAHERGIPAVHYVCPQVWAWHRGRIPKIARAMDLLLCVLPFEPPLFDGTGLDARFVGHPLVDRIAETNREAHLLMPWGTGRHRVALLPGSRASEVSRIFPTLLKAAFLLQEKTDRECSFIVPAVTKQIRRAMREILHKQPLEIRRLPLRIVLGNAREVMLQSEAAAVASGTATLEACLARCPTALVYSVSLPTELAARLLIRGVKWIGLANIIAGRTVMPELLQRDFTPQRVCDQLYSYLADPAKRKAALLDLEETAAKLGSGGASLNAAKLVAERFFDKRNT